MFKNIWSNFTFMVKSFFIVLWENYCAIAYLLYILYLLTVDTITMYHVCATILFSTAFIVERLENFIKQNKA